MSKLPETLAKCDAETLRAMTATMDKVAGSFHDLLKRMRRTAECVCPIEVPNGLRFHFALIEAEYFKWCSLADRLNEEARNKECAERVEKIKTSLRRKQAAKDKAGKQADQPKGRVENQMGGTQFIASGTGRCSAPPRNCDRFGWRDAWEKWRKENHPKKPVTYKEAYDCTAAFMDWYMGTAEKGGAK